MITISMFVTSDVYHLDICQQLILSFRSLSFLTFVISTILISNVCHFDVCQL